MPATRPMSSQTLLRSARPSEPVRPARRARAKTRPDLWLRGRACIAAGAKPHESVEVEPRRFRRQAAVEENPDQRGGRVSVAHRVVGVVELHAVPGAERLEPVIVGERLEHPERIQSAGDRSRPVLDSGGLEGGLEHGEVEARALWATKTRRRAARVAVSASSANVHASATAASLMPWIAVASSGIGQDGRTSEPNRPVSTPLGSSRTTASETISSTFRVCPGRLTVEDGVSRRSVNVASPAELARRGHRRLPHETSLAVRSDR